MSYEEREHTADVLMHVREKTLPALFEEAARALMETMYRGADSAPVDKEITFTLQGTDIEELLHAFLSEVLYLSETENYVFSQITVTLDDLNLTATLRGDPFSNLIHGGGTEVKGISFHEMSVRQENDEYVLDILFDV